MDPLYHRLVAVLDDYHDFEIIFVDDGSDDDSSTVLKRLNETQNKFHYLSLSRNFGHQLALKAGLDASTGDCVITMDGDLQHPPELIPQIIEAWQKGADIVNTIREDEKKISFKYLSSKLFYFLINKISDFPIEPGSADFRLFDRRVVDVLKDMDERSLFIRGLVSWMGYKQTKINYTPEPRFAGKSKYSISRMLVLAITGITSTSVRPLKLATMLGLTMSFIAMLYATYALGVKFIIGSAISGWTSILISALLIGGVQLVILGIIGEYIGKILIEVKHRPAYLVRESSLNRVKPPAKP